MAKRKIIGKFRERFEEIEDSEEYASIISFGDGIRGQMVLSESQSAFGEVLVAPISPQTAWRFDYGINTRFISTSGTANGGWVSGSFGMAQLSTGAGASGTSQIQTKSYIRYLPGMGGLGRFTAVYASGTANSEQIVGIGDASDGLFFGYNGVNFGIMKRRAGVDSWVYQSDWNGEELLESIIPQFGNVYQIRFQWLGFGNIYFYVFDKTKKRYVNVHTIEFPNTSTLTHILNPTLPLMAKIRNNGNTSVLNLFSPSALGAVEGTPESDFFNPLDVRNSIDAIATYSDTNNNHILTIRNKSSFNGISNRIPIKVTSINIARGSSGAPTTTIRIYKNAVTAGALSYTNIDTMNSPVDYSVTATTITSGLQRRSYTVSANSTYLLVDEPEIVVLPGETLSIGVQDSSPVATEVVVTINWNEDF